MDLGPYPWRFKPGDREHAPGSLRTVQALVNTINHGVDDSLDRDGTLELWLDEFGLPAGRPLTGSDVARTKEVREALRALLWHNGLVETDTAAAAETLERAARTAQLTIAFGGDSSELVPLDPGLDGALGPGGRHRLHVDGGRQLAADEGMPALRLGLLRPLPQPVELVVLDEVLREPHEDPRVPPPAS